MVTVEIGVGVGETVFLAKEGEKLPIFNRPETTAKKTITTTSPKTKEITLLKLSI
jgi:hypothetical protein